MAPSKKITESHPYDERMDEDISTRVPTRLILCFDGTGNSFSGNTSDTNIVKLYNKFDRCDPHQMHYYQPGIGTYPAEGTSVNTNVWGKFKRSVSQTIDGMFATSFDSHVMAGYRFLMRYYGEGDRIYVFGFSRGAFTAAFLSRMVAQIGLLSRGNEELVPFAYKTFQDYEMGKISEAYLKAFNDTYCRHEHLGGSVDNHIDVPDFDETDTASDDIDTEDESEPEHGGGTSASIHASRSKGVKVHFLGLFDTVNSVGNLDVPFTETPKIPKMSDTAEHIRHAVAVDERRVKFKPALLDQDLSNAVREREDILEVWFPGNHGDVGGGWAAPDPHAPKPTRWQKFKTLWSGLDSGDDASLDVSKDNYQQSDVALKWMIDELDKLAVLKDENGHTGDRIKWNEHKDGFMEHFKANRYNAVRAPLHDTMKFGGGSGIFKVFMWNFIDRLPFIYRWEYLLHRRWWEGGIDSVDGVLRPQWLRKTWTKVATFFGAQETVDGKAPQTGVYPGWNYVLFPLNAGATRDIPPGAVFHHSVLERMHLDPHYRPENAIFMHEERNKPITIRDAETRPDKEPTEYTALITPAKKRFVFHPFEGSDKKPKKDRIYQIRDLRETA